MSSPIHVPVMLSEIVEWLQPQPGQTMVDGTLGAGGHTTALADKVGPEGMIISFDRDPYAIQAAEQSLKGMPVQIAHSNYGEMPEVLDQLGIKSVNGIVLDLGLSSDQLADRERGFSFQDDGPLDLRFNPNEGDPAWKLLARFGQDHLANIIYRYGEERLSRRIARKIVERRRTEPIRTSAQLAAIVRSCVPRSRGEKIDPATRTFQALRIAVNEELDWLELAMKRMPDYLAPGGRLAVISFHSLEDRIVKHAFREDEKLEVLTRKPLRPTEEEVQRNPRSRSAKLRVAERV